MCMSLLYALGYDCSIRENVISMPVTLKTTFPADLLALRQPTTQTTYVEAASFYRHDRLLLWSVVRSPSSKWLVCWPVLQTPLLNVISWQILPLLAYGWLSSDFVELLSRWISTLVYSWIVLKLGGYSLGFVQTSDEAAHEVRLLPLDLQIDRTC